MSGARALCAIARADFLERVRRSSFLVTLAATGWLGWLVVRGQVTLRLGSYTGAVNDAWAGGLVAVTLSVIVSLAGFWVVKGSVERDRATRVGEILAATPLSKPAYTLGKLLSNFAVLSAIVVVLALAAPVLVFFQGEGMRLGVMFSPFLLIALPAMAVVAAFAVLFETFRPLSGGAGNVLWFFVWNGIVALPLTAGWPKADMTGLLVLYQSMGAAARASFPDYARDFSLTIAGLEENPARGTFVWNGIDWNAELIASRLAWFVIAGLIAVVAAFPFDRFDESGRRVRRTKAPGESEPERVPATTGPLPRAHLTPLTSASPSFLELFRRVYRGELRLMLRGRPWWFWAVALGLLVAELLVPLEIARARILPFAWIWPIVLWSGMGSREMREGTEDLVFSAPRPLALQLPAVYLAGVTIALVAGAGVGVRCLATLSPGAFAGWLAGALFVPALALALGAWSGASKPFEALYTVLWYIGPLQPTPALDFMGASDAGVAAAMPAVTALAAVGLLGMAVLGRRVRMNR